MHPLESAITYKGSKEFTKSELIGILAFKLRILGVKEAKELIEMGLQSGLIMERNGLLIVNEEVLRGEIESEDLFNAMVKHVARSLGWDREDVLRELQSMRERYGDLDERVLVYLLGMDRGVDMSSFKDKLEV